MYKNTRRLYVFFVRNSIMEAQFFPFTGKEHNFFFLALFSLLQYSLENPNQKRKIRKEKGKKINKRKKSHGLCTAEKIAYT